jgi:hypothetical protein
MRRLSEAASAAGYWTLATVLVNLLNGSPEFPFFEPQLASPWFATLCVVGVLVLSIAGIIAISPSKHASPQIDQRSIIFFVQIPAMLMPLASIYVWYFLKALLGKGESLLRRPRAYRLLNAAMAQPDVVDKTRMAEECLRSDPDYLRCGLFLAGLYEKAGESQQASRLYASMIRTIETVPPERRRPRENGLKAYLEGRRIALDRGSAA